MCLKGRLQGRPALAERVGDVYGCHIQHNMHLCRAANKIITIFYNIQLYLLYLLETVFELRDKLFINCTKVHYSLSVNGDILN